MKNQLFFVVIISSALVSWACDRRCCRKPVANCQPIKCECIDNPHPPEETTTALSTAPTINTPPSRTPINISSASSHNQTLHSDVSSDISLPTNITNRINVENRIRTPVNVSVSNFNQISYVLKPRVPATTRPTGPTTHPTWTYMTYPTYPTPTVGPGSTPSTTSSPTITPTPTKCCPVIQPCYYNQHQQCAYPTHYCGSECNVQKVIYIPFNPCQYQQCYRQKYVTRRECQENTCKNSIHSCASCGHDWHQTYQGYKKCNDCFSPYFSHRK